jgi:trimeric autotransporter adhesin
MPRLIPFLLIPLFVIGLLPAQTTVQITSPASGVAVNPGQTVQVSVSVSGTVSSVALACPDPIMGAFPINTPPYQFSLQIPTDISPGLYSVTAIAASTPGHPVFSAPIQLDVERPDSPVSYGTVPSTMDLAVGETTWIQLYGNYSDGSQIDLTKSTSTTYSSQNPAIVTVTPTGQVTAISPGRTQVVVDGIVTIPVYVKPPVRILPLGASLSASQTKKFIAISGNRARIPYTWTVSPAGAGTIDSTGLYTAPSTITSDQTATVTATNPADATQTASVAVHLVGAVSVTVSPGSAQLSKGQTQQFTGVVSGTGDAGMLWSANPLNAGSLDTSGNYTAPSPITSAQTVTITATSLADLTKSASATVSLIPSVQVNVTPGSATLLPSESQQFSAAVQNASNTSVTWSINPSSLGSITANGLYTAPSSIAYSQSVTVTATSNADNTASASAYVTLQPSISGPPVSGLPAPITATEAVTPSGGPSGSWYTSVAVNTAPSGSPFSTTSPANLYNAWSWNPYGFQPGTSSAYTAYSSYDPTLYAQAGGGNLDGWSRINWLLNNKTGASRTLHPTVMDIQYCIWNLLIPGYSTSNMTADGIQLLSDATLYGRNFVPSWFQTMAIALYAGGINPADNGAVPEDVLVEYPVPFIF